MTTRRDLLRGVAAAAGVALLSHSSPAADPAPVNISPNWTPRTIFFYSVSFTGGYTFPQMVRLSSISTPSTVLNPEIVFSTPMRLWGLQLDSSLQTRAATGALGVAVLLGQTANLIAYSSAVGALAMQMVLPDRAASQSEFVEFGPRGLLVPVGSSLALYGFGDVAALGTNKFCASANLYITEETAA